MSGTSTATVSAGQERRRLDAAALQCLDAFENNAPIVEIMKHLIGAALMQHMPLTVSSHERSQLETMCAKQGLSAASRIEKAMSAGPGSGATLPLSADTDFQHYIALRLQLAEGAQLAAACRRSDEDLLDSFGIFVEATLALFRFENDGTDPAHSHGVGTKEDGASFMIAAGKLREAARTALIHAAREMEALVSLVVAYSGERIELRAQPTAAFSTDQWLDDDEEDRAAGQAPATDDDGVPNVHPPVLTKAVFKVITSSESRAARITVSAVRKAAASTAGRVSAAAAAVDRYAEAVEGLVSGKPNETLRAASPRSRAASAAARPRVTLDSRPVKAPVFDPVRAAEDSRNLPMSPAAQLTRQVRTFRGVFKDVPVDRQEMKEYLKRRREARLARTQRGDLTVWTKDAFPQGPHAHASSFVSGARGGLALSFTGMEVGSPGGTQALSGPPSPSGSGSASSHTDKPALSVADGSPVRTTRLPAVLSQLQALAGQMQAMAGERGPTPSVGEAILEVPEGSPSSTGQGPDSASPQDKAALSSLAQQLNAVTRALADAMTGPASTTGRRRSLGGTSYSRGRADGLGNLGSPGGTIGDRGTVITTASRRSTSSRRSARMGPSSLVQELANEVEAKAESLRADAARITEGDVPMSPGDLGKTRRRREHEMGKEARGAVSAANSLASPVTRRLTSASRTVVVPKDAGKKDSYLRMHDHPDQEIVEELTARRQAAADAGRPHPNMVEILWHEAAQVPSAQAGHGEDMPDMPLGSRLLSQALSRAASQEPAVKRSISVKKARSPSKGPMAEAAVKDIKTVILPNDHNMVVAGYVTSQQDLAARAGKVIPVPPAERPPTSSSMGAGVAVWEGVWKEGTALVDPQAAARARSVSPRPNRTAALDGTAASTATASTYTPGLGSSPSPSPGFAATGRPGLSSPAGHSATSRPGLSSTRSSAGPGRGRGSTAGSSYSPSRTVGEVRSSSPSHAARYQLKEERQAAVADKVERKRAERAEKYHAAGELTHLQRRGEHIPGVKLLEQALAAGPAVAHQDHTASEAGSVQYVRAEPVDREIHVHYTPVKGGHGAFDGHAGVGSTPLASIPPGTPLVALDISRAAVHDRNPSRHSSGSSARSSSQAVQQHASGSSSPTSIRFGPSATSAAEASGWPLPSTEKGLQAEVLEAYVRTSNAIHIEGTAGAVAGRLSKLLFYLRAYPGLTAQATEQLGRWGAALSALSPDEALPSDALGALSVAMNDSFGALKDVLQTQDSATSSPSVTPVPAPTAGAVAARASSPARSASSAGSPARGSPVAQAVPVDPAVAAQVAESMRDPYEAAYAGQGDASFVSPRKSVLAKLRKSNAHASGSKAEGGRTRAGGLPVAGETAPLSRPSAFTAGGALVAQDPARAAQAAATAALVAGRHVGQPAQAAASVPSSEPVTAPAAPASSNVATSGSSIGGGLPVEVVQEDWDTTHTAAQAQASPSDLSSSLANDLYATLMGQAQGGAGAVPPMLPASLAPSPSVGGGSVGRPGSALSSRKSSVASVPSVGAAAPAGSLAAPAPRSRVGTHASSRSMGSASASATATAAQAGSSRSLTGPGSGRSTPARKTGPPSRSGPVESDVMLTSMDGRPASLLREDPLSHLEALAAMPLEEPEHDHQE